VSRLGRRVGDGLPLAERGRRPQVAVGAQQRVPVVGSARGQARNVLERAKLRSDGKSVCGIGTGFAPRMNRNGRQQTKNL
jgi:hypothetical protein